MTALSSWSTQTASRSRFLLAFTGVGVVIAFDILLFLELVLLEAGSLIGVPIFGIVGDCFLELNLRFLGLKLVRSLCSLSAVRFSELRIAESHSLALSRTAKVSEWAYGHSTKTFSVNSTKKLDRFLWVLSATKRSRFRRCGHKKFAEFCTSCFFKGLFCDTSLVWLVVLTRLTDESFEA